MAEKTPLRLACDMYAERVGSCPYDMHDLYEPWEESCYEKCSAFIDYAECWETYFIQQAEKGQLMDSIKDPIERLRSLAAHPSRSSLDCDTVHNALDEIEAQYLKLPVDADGVPIRPGDLLVDTTSDYELYATKMFLGLNGWAINARRPDELRHVKPDTVESVLQEFALACEEQGYKNPRIDGIVEEYADRIRKAVEE